MGTPLINEHFENMVLPCFKLAHSSSDAKILWHCDYWWKMWTKFLLGRSLMISLRKNSWKLERVPTEVTFVGVCLSVCLSVDSLQGTLFGLGTARILIFVLNDPWDMKKKCISCLFVFLILIFSLFIDTFRCFLPFILSLFHTPFFLFLKICPVTP